jgi:Ni/Co efflux regulator RcnB
MLGFCFNVTLELAMTKFNLPFRGFLMGVFALSMAAVAGEASAEKPAGTGGGGHKQKSHQSKQHENRDDSRHGQAPYSSRPQNYPDQYYRQGGFAEQQRIAIREYYANEFRAGHCPPGLAKKHNGCLPPGQAKRWTKGRPLPRDLIFYDLPDGVIRQIGYPPTGYRYVRIASDVLMITIGTGMVVDAIADLTGMP